MSSAVSFGIWSGRAAHLAAMVFVHGVHDRLEPQPCYRSTLACARSGGGGSVGHPLEHGQQAREVRHIEGTVAVTIERLWGSEG